MLHQEAAPAGFNPLSLQDEFDPALVYLFDPEAVDRSGTILELILWSYGQFLDMLHAYEFAKNKVLPWIREHGKDAITPEKLLTWLKESHRLLARSLGDGAGFMPGRYTARQVIRWHWGHSHHTLFGSHVYGDDQTADVIKTSIENGLSPDEAQKLLLVLNKIGNDKQLLNSIKVNLKRLSIQNYKIADVGVSMIIIAANEPNYLSKEERMTLRKLVTICQEPKKLPALMEQFAVEFVQKWKECDAQSDDQLANLLYDGFYGVTEIHPFANANGRTATWLLNIILRSFDKPSIALREPGDKANKESLYSQAIEQIEVNPALFKKHVLIRIQQTATKGHLDISAVRETINYRVATFLFVQEQLKSHHHTTMLFLCNHIHQKVNTIIYEKFTGDLNHPSHEVLEYYAQWEYLLLKESFVTTPDNPSIVSLFAGQVVSYKYNPDEINEIKQLLAKLLGHDKWTAYKGGTTMLLNLQDDADAMDIKHNLNPAGAGRVELKREPKTKNPVIQFSDINLLRLRKYVNSLTIVDSATPNARK